MFNSYVDHKFNFNVNAVSGTLRKTMKDSKFIIRKLDAEIYLFSPEHQSLGYKTDPIVILQIMLIGNNQCLIEYVEKDIFDKIMSDSENGSFKQDEKWQDGADFDCNKANEWHYVKDGDLPKDEEWKWCVSSSGYPYIAKYEELFVSWTSQENKEVMCPYAWKEIVIPE